MNDMLRQQLPVQCMQAASFFFVQLQGPASRLSNLIPSLWVNVDEDPGAIIGNVFLEESLSTCEGLVIVWRWCCSTH